MRCLAFILLLCSAAFLLSCARRVHVPNAGENRTVEYVIGAPNFDMEAVATARDGQTGFDLYVSLPRASLVFVRDGDAFRAGYDLRVKVRSQGRIVHSEEWTHTVAASSYEDTQSFESLRRVERINLDVGDFEVEVVIEDAQSGADAIRRQDVRLLDVLSSEPALSELLLEAARGGESFVPVLSVHVPGNFDSLRAVTELYNVPEGSEAVMTLVRFATDTTAAAPPFWFTPAPFTLPYLGVDYEAADTIQITRRAIRDANEQFFMEFAIPELEHGTYAAIVEVRSGQMQAQKRRYWTVKSPTFPRITSLVEMVYALRYIAREEEMVEILSAPTVREMRRRFDAFWAARVPNRQGAAALLETYYTRIEQANILFSNQKAGWKTDRGMIYVIFGAPAYEEDLATRKEWYYFESGGLLNRRLPPFVFRRSMAYGYAGLFDTYVLQRSESYEDDWRRRVEDWREGRAL